MKMQIYKNFHVAVTALLAFMLIGCTSQPVNDVPRQINDPTITEVGSVFETQTERVNNCDGANPTYVVSYKTIESQKATFEVTVEAGGLVTGTPIPSALEVQLEAKIAAALAKDYGITTEKNHEIALTNPQGTYLEHTITWKVTRVKGLIEVVYGDGIAQVAFDQVAGVELYDRTSRPVANCPSQSIINPTQSLKPTSTDRPTATRPSATNSLVVTDTPFVPTPKPSSPEMYNFSACLQPCNGANARRDFPGGTTRIYVEWDYRNIPYGADYQRVWTMDGKEWIRYSCTWTGNSDGHDAVELREPYGLHSGTWEMRIYINGKMLIKEQIYLSGNHTYWDPAGTLNKCYGLTD